MAKTRKRRAPLTAEERAIEEGIKRGEWVPVVGSELEHVRAEAESASRAGAESRKEARTNVRLAQADMDALKAAAERRGIGYQTLIASVLHMYVNDELLHVDEVRKLARLGLFKDKAS